MKARERSGQVGEECWNRVKTKVNEINSKRGKDIYVCQYSTTVPTATDWDYGIHARLKEAGKGRKKQDGNKVPGYSELVTKHF